MTPFTLNDVIRLYAGPDPAFVPSGTEPVSRLGLSASIRGMV
jgi:hypothetical protein